MIRRGSYKARKRPVEGNNSEGREITFPSLWNISSADLVIIKAYVSGRQVNRVYLDGRSSCEVIYEYCFLKLKPSIRSLQYNPGESKEEQRATNEEHQEEVKGILSCVNAEDRIVVNDQYFRTDNHHRETTSNKIKIRLQDLLRVYADVFAWTTAHMMRVPKTIMIAGEAFNIEHRVNELNQ
ncbi:hypothetical protein Tco_1141925 [Tanacetum coccineum]